MTKTPIAFIRLLAAVIVLTAVLRSDGQAHEPQVDGACVFSKLAGVACVDIIEPLHGYVCQIGNPCITCHVWSDFLCRYKDITLPGFGRSAPLFTDS